MCRRSRQSSITGTDAFVARRRALRVALESGDSFLLRCLVSGGFVAAIRASQPQLGTLW
jgi:hypothetical protein